MGFFLYSILEPSLMLASRICYFFNAEIYVSWVKGKLTTDVANQYIVYTLFFLSL